jgi:hypothetical protein
MGSPSDFSNGVIPREQSESRLVSGQQQSVAGALLGRTEMD